MENRPFDPEDNYSEEEDDEEEKDKSTDSSKETRPSFLGNLFKEDEAKDEKAPKPSFLKSLFEDRPDKDKPKETEVTPVETDGSSPTEAHAPNETDATVDQQPIDEILEPVDSESNQHQQADQVNHHSEEIPTSDETTANEINEPEPREPFKWQMPNFDREEEPTAASVPAERINVSPEEPQIPEASDSIDTEPTLETEETNEEPEDFEHRHVPSVESPAVNVSVPTDSLKPKDTDNTTVINNSGTALGLVGLGVGAWAHHRISKTNERVGDLELEKRKQEKQIDELKKEQMNQTHHIKDILNKPPELSKTKPAVEHLPTSFLETLDRVSRDENTKEVINPDIKEESKPNKTPSFAEVINKAAKEKIEESKPEKKTPELTTPNITYLKGDEVLRPPYLDQSNELIFNQAKTAAEHNIPLENQYELRHEVKDVATGSANLQYGDEAKQDQTSSVNDEALKAYLDKVAKGAKEQKTAGDIVKQAKTKAYQQAVWAGVAGAILILLALSFWLLG